MSEKKKIVEKEQKKVPLEKKLDLMTDEQVLQELKDKGLLVFGSKIQRLQRLKQFYGIEPLIIEDKEKKPKSNVVEEIQKMQQKRDERRAKQEEMKIEKIEKEAENIKSGKNVDIDFQVMIERQKIKQAMLRKHAKLNNDQIQVIIRKRPISQSEEINGEIDCLSSANPQIIVHEPKHRVDRSKVVVDHVFIFDNTYNEKESSEDIFQSIEHLIPEIIDKGVLTCFAYGFILKVQVRQEVEKPIQ